MSAVAAVRPPVEEPPPEAGPRFRDDVELLALESWQGGPTRWYARQPESRELFELGREAAFLCRHLDGRTSPAELHRRLEEEFGTPAEEDDVEIFLEQLARSGLLAGSVPQRGPATLPEIFDPDVFLPVARIRIGRGDRMAAFCARRLRFAFTRPFHALALAVVGWAIVVFVRRFDELGTALAATLSPGFLLLVAAASSLLVQSPRSLIHAVVCKRYGRQVTEAAVALLYHVLPAVFFDWSDLAWVRDRGKRFWAIFSGIYYQAVVWGVALLAWHLTRPGSAANTAWLAVALAAGLGLVLFNANPLVKMDGYLLLVNGTEMPRLRERALAAFGAWAAGKRRPEVLTRRERRWFVVYGLLCSSYAVFHFSLLFWGVWHFLVGELTGAGAALTLGLALFAVHRPLGVFMNERRSIRWLFHEGGAARRWGVRTLLLAILGGLMLVPYPYETSGPVTLFPASRYEIRPEVEGMVEQVLVEEGERVEVGQPVLQLVRRVHEGRLQAAEAQLAEKRAQLRLARKGATPEEIAAAEQRVSTAEAQLDWSTIRAERYRALVGDELVSQQEYENALQVRDVDRQELAEAEADLRYVRREVRSEAVEALEAEVRSLEVVVESYQGDVERTVVATPFAGVVATPRVRELAGRYVKPGQREVVVEVQEVDRLRAEVEIREQDLGAVRLGSRVRVVTWPYPDRIFVGAVTAIAPVANTEARMVVDKAGLALGEPDEKVLRVTMELPNPEGLLRPELTGYAKIQVGERLVGDVLFRPFVRWCQVEVWSWIP